MLKISAKKRIDLYRAQCLLQLKVEEKRPDLVWYLKNIGRWGLSVGETNNMERYLSYLGLISEGELTDTGRKAVKTGKVMVPEAGLYEILYTKDVAFGNRIITIQRKRPVDVIEGNTEEFLDYELYDQRIYRDLNNAKHSMGEFWLKFERPKGENPKIIYAGTLEASVELRKDSSNSFLDFTLNKSRYNIKERQNLEGFSAELNIKNWIKSWNRDLSAMEVSYEEAKKNPAMLNNFKTTLSLQGRHLEFSQGTDEDDWDVDITLSVAPKTVADADKWISHLTIEKMEEKNKYIRKKNILKIQEGILQNSTIISKFPDFSPDIENTLDKLKKEKKEIYYMVLAAEDLTLELEAGD